MPVRGTTGDVEALAHYAGQSAGIVRHVGSAAAILDELVTGAAEALGAMTDRRRRPAIEVENRRPGTA
jgi:hypothetical protein